MLKFCNLFARSLLIGPLVFLVFEVWPAPSPLSAATFTWDSTASSSTWSLASNWGDGAVPSSGDIALFNAGSYSAAGSQPTLLFTANLGGLWDTGGGAITISGSALSLYGTTINGNAGTGIELDATAGSLTLNAPLVLQNNQQWINNSLSPITVNGAVSGNSALTTSGNGTIVLAASNSYSGGTTVDGGVLRMGNNGALGSGSGALNLNGGTFDVHGFTVSAGALSGGGNINNLSGGGQLNFGIGDASSTFSGTVQASIGTLTLNKSGSGTFYQSGGSVQPNFFDVNGGAYNLSGGGVLASSFEYLGDASAGALAQSGGTNSVGSTIYCGYSSSVSGSYSLSAGLLSSLSQVMGYSGSGSLVQTGGTNSFNNLYLGYNGTSTGSYNLGGSGVVQATNEEYVGFELGSSGSFTQTGGSNTTPNLSVGNAGLGAYNLSGVSLLSASNEYLGNSGTGSFTQSGGTNSVNTLYLGNNTSSSGSYNLSGSAVISTAGNEYVGYSGTGSFTQSGGTNSLIVLYMGYNGVSSSGNYNLSGSGVISTAGNEYAGYSGIGSFTQTGGTNSAGAMYLGLNTGSSGSYNLGGSGLLSTNNVYVGSSGSGSFIQTGGTLQGLSLVLGYLSGASGSYNLSGSGLLSTTYEYVGYSGTGSFTQSGGTNSFAILDVGFNANSHGSYNLSGSGVIFGGNENLGNALPSTFTQSGGTNNASTLAMGNATGVAGTYNLSGAASTVNANNEYVGNSGPGNFVQTAGTNTANTLYVGKNAGASGSYSLSGAAASLTTNNNEYVGFSGTGSFVQTGGLHNSNDLYLGFNLGSSGSYTLSGAGSVLTSEVLLVGYGGNGTFTQNGGINNPYGQLTLGGTGSGLYNLNGGYLNAGQLTVNGNGTFSDQFNQGGGTNASSNLFLSASNAAYFLNAGLMAVPNQQSYGYFSQSGGTNMATFLYNDSEYTMTAGALQINGGFQDDVGGSLFGNGDNVAITASNSIVDFSNGSVVGFMSGGSLSIGPNSLLLLPAGLNIAADFKYFSNLGYTHVVGTTLTVLAGETINGVGTINDPVICQGTINVTNGFFGIYLNDGLNISGTGSVNLGYGELNIGSTSGTAAASGMSGGYLSTYYMIIGYNGGGSFTQTGGSDYIGQLNVGFNYSGTYSLSAPGLLETSAQIIGYNNPGTFIQTGGTNYAGSLQFGQGGNVGPGYYNLSGGLLEVDQILVGSGSGLLTFSGGTIEAVGSGLVQPAIVLSNPTGTDTINTNGYTLTVTGPVSGPENLIVAGSGMLIFSNTTPTAGTFQVNSGTMQFNGANETLGSGSIRASAGAVVQFANATINGGYLRGPGTYMTMPRTVNFFSGVTTYASTMFQQNGADTFTNFTNGGPVANYGTLLWDGGQNGIGGSLTVFSQVNTDDFTNAGAIRINSGGVINNSLSDLTSGGGGQITINSGGTLNADSQRQGVALDLQDSLLVNNGTVTGTTNINYGATVQGYGSFGLVNINDGGTLDIAPSASPVMPAAVAAGGSISGSGTASQPVLIVGSLDLITPNSTDRLVLSGDVAGTGSVTKLGPGTVVLSGSNRYSGGMSVEAGTLIIDGADSLPDGSSLMVGADASLLFAPSNAGPSIAAPAAAVSAVPEPGTLVLLSVASALSVIYCTLRRLQLHQASKSEKSCRFQPHTP
jgi:autotransporter-associated beta strand protein/T5SS/PEP-CTERM-associated repeat protein